MALLEDVVTGWGGGVLVGLGAAAVAPVILPGGSGLRTATKVLLKGVLLVSDQMRSLAAETTEQLKDLVAEVKAESAASEGTSRPHLHRPRQPSHT